MGIEIQAKAIAATFPHVSTDKSRPLLNGIFLREDGVVAATDGYSIGCYRRGHTGDTNLLLKTSSTTTKRLLRKAAKRPDEKYVLNLSERILTLGDEQVLVEVEENPNYPRFEQVFPKWQNPEPIPAITFDDRLAGRFGIAHFYFSDPLRAVLVRTKDEDFVGAFMPYGNGKAPLAPEPCPRWLFPREEGELREGDRVRVLADQIDDDDGSERVTPAGSKGQITQIEPLTVPGVGTYLNYHVVFDNQALLFFGQDELQEIEWIDE